MVRMQNDAKLPPNERYNYRHAIDGLIRIQREETIRGLFRGLGPNINRAILMSASQLATYDKFKEMLLGTGVFRDNYITHFGASSLSVSRKLLGSRKLRDHNNDQAMEWRLVGHCPITERWF